MKLPFLIAMAFLIVLFFSGCSDEQLAVSERIAYGAYSEYRRPAYYPPAPVVVAPVTPYTY